MLAGHGTPCRASGKDCTFHVLEWTYSDASGTVDLDETQSDQDVNIPTPVVKNATAITDVTFPKSTRAWVLGWNLSAGTPATGANARNVEVTDLNANAGTCKVRFFDLDGTPSAVDPSSGTRFTLHLRLERP
jgi:hypothetical protein